MVADRHNYSPGWRKVTTLTRELLVGLAFLLLAAPGILAVGFISSTPAYAETQANDSSQIFKELSENVHKITLSNGLRVLVYRRPQAPVFNGQVWIKVGGVDEKPGITGLAHFLEHMAFKGTDRIGTKDFSREQKLLEKLDQLMTGKLMTGKLMTGEVSDPAKHTEQLKAVYEELDSIWDANEFSKLYKQRGAVGMNAGTGKDYTMYLVSLPSNAFEFWCWMESERLLRPVFRQFYKEREVIREERRMRVDNDPDGKLYEGLIATAYWAHPNRLPIIGWPSDMARLSAPDMKEFYKTYYRPDNIVVSIVGDIDPEQARPLLEQYFGRLPRVEGPIPQVSTVEEPQRGERVSIVEYDAEPQFFMAFHKPTYPNPDDAQFAILHSVLSDGRSSVFYRELVQQKQIAASVDTTEAPGERFPSLFIVTGVPQKGVSSDRLRDEVQKILDRAKVEPFSKERIEAAKRRVRVGVLTGLQSNYGLAQTLGRTEVLWGDWKVMLKVYDQILKTTSEDLMRIAQTYLTIENRTYAKIVKPEGKQ